MYVNIYIIYIYTHNIYIYIIYIYTYIHIDTLTQIHTYMYTCTVWDKNTQYMSGLPDIQCLRCAWMTSKWGAKVVEIFTGGKDDIY